MSRSQNTRQNPGRAVVIRGARTPFVRAFGDLMRVDTIALGATAVRGVLEKVGLSYKVVDGIVWGGVILPSASPNVAREIALPQRGETPRALADRERLNVHGGSLALGHPFGATGARMVTTMANALARTGKRTAVLGICAAGGLGAAAVLERFD